MLLIRLRTIWRVLRSGSATTMGRVDSDCGGFSSGFGQLQVTKRRADSGVENLIKLPYLHEPAILHCLEQRYSE